MKQYGCPIFIRLPKFLDEQRNLSVIEELKNIPFKVERAYWSYDVPGRETIRSIKENDEFIIAISGAFDVILDNVKEKLKFQLKRSYYGLFVPKAGDEKWSYSQPTTWL